MQDALSRIYKCTAERCKRKAVSLQSNHSRLALQTHRPDSQHWINIQQFNVIGFDSSSFGSDWTCQFLHYITCVAASRDIISLIILRVAVTSPSTPWHSPLAKRSWLLHRFVSARASCACALRALHSSTNATPRSASLAWSYNGQNSRHWHSFVKDCASCKDIWRFGSLSV